MIDNCMLDETIYSSRVYRKEHLLLAVPKWLEANRKALPYQVPVEMIYDGSFLSGSVAPVSLTLFGQGPYIMLKPENDTRKRAMRILANENIIPDIVFELDQQLTSYHISCLLYTSRCV